MSVADDLDFLALAHELINENGRSFTVGKMLDVQPDATKPWKGAGTGVAPTLSPSYTILGVFLPDMTLGLIGGSGFGRMDIIAELAKQSEQVVLVAHPDGVTLADFTSCNVVVDNGVRFRIHARKVLMPGETPIFYALGLIR
jgi:hypothetical protein